MKKAAKTLTGKPIFASNLPAEQEFRSFFALCERVKARLTQWGWQPQDLWDVQGFLWVATQDEWLLASSPESKEEETMTEKLEKHALNTILFGPPGTGKTWRTAEMAVRICRGSSPADRGELMKQYRELQESGRVVFTTFHQSMSYEEFVEGLRPVAGEDGVVSEGGAVAASLGGFRLEARNGIFRDLCARAEEATRQSAAGAAFDLSGRNFYKMSLGQRWEEEHVYEAAMEGNYIVLGWGGDQDWSDPKYADYWEVQARWKELGQTKAGNSGDVAQVSRFCKMKLGDLVIVADGNMRFRAVGEVKGDYQFVQGTPGGNHRRNVRWLLKPKEPLPVEMIYGARFSMAACYELSGSEIKKPALAELLRPPATPAEAGDGVPYVLIIDEINRANISKVLGELITLLEPDKRLGAENEITLTLPYSQRQFGVPKNLYMIGTMNTADRSIAPIDTALRRRFEFVPMVPDYEVLKGREIEGIPLGALLRGINDRVEWLFDRDHLLGHAFFVGVKSRTELDRVMRTRIVPLLAEYFFEDWVKVRIALNDKEGYFVREEKLAHPAMEAENNPRMRYVLGQGAVPTQAYQAALGRGPGDAGA